MPPARRRAKKPIKKKKATASKTRKPRRGNLHFEDSNWILNAGARLDAALNKEGSHEKMIKIAKAVLAALQRDKKRKANIFTAIRSDPNM